MHRPGIKIDQDPTLPTTNRCVNPPCRSHGLLEQHLIASDILDAMYNFFLRGRMMALLRMSVVARLLLTITRLLWYMTTLSRVLLRDSLMLMLRDVTKLSIACMWRRVRVATASQGEKHKVDNGENPKAKVSLQFATRWRTGDLPDDRADCCSSSQSSA